jgi:hypothetical protein
MRAVAAVLSVLFLAGLFVAAWVSLFGAPTPQPGDWNTAGIQPAPAPAAPAKPIRFRISRDTIGCLSADDFHKLVRLKVDKDEEAFAKQLTAYFQTGRCKMIAKGQEVFISSAGVFSGVPCVRPRGETECLYTVSEAVESIPE